LRIKRYQLTRKFSSDPLEGHNFAAERFIPLALPGAYYTRRVYKRVLAGRKIDQPFEMSLDKRLGVVIPYRNREAHLEQLLPVLINKLEEQGIDYRIAIVEQDEGKLFNLGRMRNIGAIMLSGQADYFCFHDVDNLPVVADYSCPSHPLRLMSGWADTERKFDVFANDKGYVYFSGVVSITKQQYKAANGYANNYWGWGVEDDDFYLRCLLSGLVPYRDSRGLFSDLANPEYYIDHSDDPVVEKNRRSLRFSIKFGWVGRSGVRQAKFKVLKESNRAARISHYLVHI
jgi:hypothetical protein